MKFIIFSVCVFAIMLISCNNKNICNISGTLDNAEDSTMLYLADFEFFNIVDSIVVVNGTFSHKMQLTHPEKFVLHNKRNRHEFRDRKFIWLEPSDITINGDFNFLKNLKVNGSVSNLEFERYNQLLDTTNKRINTIQEQIHLKPEGEKVTDQITIDSLKEELNNEIVHFMMNHNKSYVFLSELHSECYLAFRHLNKEQIKNVYNNFSNELRGTVKGIEIKKYLELPDPPKIGDMAPKIIQVTPSGDTVKLSDYKGKYVLLDFWSSSCGPCRGEFKGLRKLYSKYNPKGLEILGVSGDINKRRWVDAIKQDSISWVNISDLRGWKNEAFLLYDVKMIPKKFLINPEGVIIKDNFSEYSVEYELKKIFEIKNGL